MNYELDSNELNIEVKKMEEALQPFLKANRDRPLDLNKLMEYLLTHGYGREEKIAHDTAADIIWEIEDDYWDGEFFRDEDGNIIRDEEHKEKYGYYDRDVCETLDDIRNRYNLKGE